MVRRHPHDVARKALRSLGLGLPETATHSPWPEHLDLVVKGKTFVFLNVDGQPFRASFKLPESQEKALEMPFVSPTGYGLSKSGWVSVRLEDGDDVPTELFKEWLMESFVAQAPKKLIQSLEQPLKVAKTTAKKKAARKSP
jgi:predicted DNA-binding protein (MmcQ/YjbR family)